MLFIISLGIGILFGAVLLGCVLLLERHEQHQMQRRVRATVRAWTTHDTHPI